MPERLTHSKTGEMLKMVDLTALVSAKTAENKTNMLKLAKAMGRNESYLYTKLKNKDQPVSVLLLLSYHLQSNLFEPYMKLLPENVSITQKEKDLQAQIADLQKQLADLAKERDIYKNILMQPRQ